MLNVPDTNSRAGVLPSPLPPDKAYSHSMVPGGFEVMS
jgi:hypothetical protein